MQSHSLEAKVVDTTPVVPKLPSLRKMRESRFLTQQELAERAGLALTTVARLEAGKTVARLRTVRTLAKALGCKPVDLVREP